MFRVYFEINDHTRSERCAEIAVSLSHDTGNAMIEAFFSVSLAKMYFDQRRLEESEKFCERAIRILKVIREREIEAEAYTCLGRVSHMQRKYQKAKGNFEKALAIHIEIRDKKGEADARTNLGAVLHSLGEYQKTKEYFEKALAIYMEIRDKKGEADARTNLGEVLRSLGEYQKAKEYFEKALAIYMEIRDKKGEAHARTCLGEVLYSLSEYQKAKEYYEKALAIFMEIRDKKEEAHARTNLGAVLYSLGEYQKAKEYNEKTLAISMEIRNKEIEAHARKNLGVVLRSLGEYQKAEEYSEKALAIFMEIRDKKGEAHARTNLGVVLYLLSEYQKAKEYFEKALAISMEIRNKEIEAHARTNLGEVFDFLGEYQKAKEYHEKALAISMEITDRRGEADARSNLGSLLFSLGEFQKAKEYLEKALSIFMEISGRQGAMKCFIGLGSCFLSLGKYRDAHEHGEKALSIAMETGDRAGEAAAYGILGEVRYSLLDYQMAKTYNEKQIFISTEIGRRLLEATAYLAKARILQHGKQNKAVECIEKALLICGTIGDIRGNFAALAQLSYIKVLQSKFQEAESHLHECIAKYEKLRHSLHGNEQFQVSLLDTRGLFPYKMLSELLCHSRNPKEALYVEELARARCLAESMALNFSAENHISSDPKSWFRIEEISREEENCTFLYISYYYRKVRLWVLKSNGDTLFRSSEVVDDKTLIAEKAFNLNSFFDQDLRGFGILPAHKCEDRSLSETMPISLHDQSEADLRGEETPETTRRLNLCSKLIITPVADLLTEPEIVIVPERSLYRVPFAALRDKSDGRYISETHRIRIVPSLTTLKLIQDCPADFHSETGAVVVGDPKVGKVYYMGGERTFVPLHCARKEAEIIGELLGVQPLLGERAKKQEVLQAMNSVSLIHIAAHGNAERGEIALSPSLATNTIPEEEDYLLRISDVSQVKLRAKLVVLSCCHSGRGEIKAEGVIGIARAFLASGARSVLVTLWAIEDEATEKFMRRFYRHLVDGDSVSECLHQAMKWLRSNGFPKVSQWAPFMLIGDNVTFDVKKQRLVLFPKGH
ncbi:unnamed protein product [Pocillopora meandrina]|uniref:CHAT domain-containing protein n=1 Tax=Pocillopora meandrina TaxID=46732 RepID=A0AAU9WY26_9CNID|nr:unnamed protein product [Pocillopora meandrina]